MSDFGVVAMVIGHLITLGRIETAKGVCRLLLLYETLIMSMSFIKKKLERDGAQIHRGVFISEVGRK